MDAWCRRRAMICDGLCRTFLYVDLELLAQTTACGAALEIIYTIGWAVCLECLDTTNQQGKTIVPQSSGFHAGPGSNPFLARAKVRCYPNTEHVGQVESRDIQSPLASPGPRGQGSRIEPFWPTLEQSKYIHTEYGVHTYYQYSVLRMYRCTDIWLTLSLCGGKAGHGFLFGRTRTKTTYPNGVA